MSETEQAICKGCHTPFTRATVTPHLREYCSQACRQKAYRNREKERQHNVTVDTEAQARIIELEQALTLSQQNLAVSQEKLSQAGSHIQKLERQGEAQRQRLGQYTSELARYRKIIDLTDRDKMVARFLLIGEQVGYVKLESVELETGPHAWYTFSQQADDELLGRGIVAAETKWLQQANLQTLTAVAKQEKIITDLRQKLHECEKRKQA